MEPRREAVGQPSQLVGAWHDGIHRGQSPRWFVEGDRVLLDPGTTYVVLEESGDVVVLMNGGGQLVLAGVSLSSLTGDWIAVG